MNAKPKVEQNKSLTKATPSVVAVASNPWSKLAAELDKVLGAPILKYTKDGRFALSDTDNVPDGTRCIARVDLIQTGWTKWQDNVKVESRMGAVADSFVPPARATLGDLEEADWETQPDGSKRDPWQFQLHHRKQGRPQRRQQADPNLRRSSGARGGRSADRRAKGRLLQAQDLRKNLFSTVPHRLVDR
jgi:hypothetical protein